MKNKIFLFGPKKILKVQVKTSKFSLFTGLKLQKTIIFPFMIK